MGQEGETKLPAPTHPRERQGTLSTAQGRRKQLGDWAQSAQSSMVEKPNQRAGCQGLSLIITTTRITVTGLLAHLCFVVLSKVISSFSSFLMKRSLCSLPRTCHKSQTRACENFRNIRLVYKLLQTFIINTT